LRIRLRIGLLLVAALPLLPGVGEAAGSAPVSGTPPKIDSRLADIARRPGGGAVDEARRRGLPVAGDSVLVDVLGETDPAATTSTIDDLGGSIVAERDSRFLVEMPPEALLSLAADPSVAFVTVPAEPVTDGVMDEGVSGQGADVWHDAGFDGSGINVLVVDSGFSELASAQATGDLPASLAGSGVGPTCSEGSLAGPDAEDTHGTAVAEIVHDMAPGASLYLYRTCLLWDGPDLARFIAGHGIDVVSQSLAYFNTVPLDGRDPWGAFSHIDEVVDQGVLWFNSAGNYRRRHWRGTWSGTETLDFGGGATTIEVPIESGEAVYLRWDDWRLNLGGSCSECGSDLDLDLYLLDQFGTVVASSTTVQSSVSPGPPLEAVDAPWDGVFRIQVRARPGQSIPTSLAIDLFVPSHDLPDGFQVFAGSLNDTATLDSVISVGAVCWADSNIRPYSSEGPTTGGQLKPDISAFDGVSTLMYGASASCGNGFLGTSAATPNAAGAAAVMMEASGARGSEARELLSALTVDLGPLGPDNRYGVGRLALGEAPSGQCDGQAGTIIALPGQRAVQGTEGSDVIVGNSRDNEIHGSAGADVICGLEGDDLVVGGGGADLIKGNGGRDDLRGGKDADVVYGGGGDDTLAGGTGADSLDGGRGRDDCRGGTATHCEV